MNNKQKVTVELRNGKFRLPDGARLEELNPKALLLCATAQCAGLTVMGILAKDHISLKRLEISIEGTLDTEKLQADSRFMRFNVAYNVECRTMSDQHLVSEAIRDAQDRLCGLIALLKCAAPVTHEIYIVSNETVKA
ncbi:MAG: OsmC family protein [Alistipes sp.]|nr:OsmC family protein [Alistipes sp.]